MDGGIECSGWLYDVRNASADIVRDGFTKPYLEEILTYTVFALVVVFGLAANGLFIFVVYKVDKMRTVMNAYLVNLAVADMMILGYGYVDRLYFYLSTPLSLGTEFLGPVYCIVSALFELTYYVSLFTVALFSMERYTAVCHPLRHIKISTSSRTRSFLIGTWIFAAVLAICQIPGKGRREALCILFPEAGEFGHLSGDVHYCTGFVPFYHDAVGVPLQLFPFYSAIVGTAYCYTTIILTLVARERTAIAGGERDRQTTAKTTRARYSATRMIIINGCVFFICNAPIQLYVTVTWLFDIVDYEIRLPMSDQRNVFLVLTILLYLNSAVNPVIYGVTNRQYRTAFLEAFQRRRRGDHGKLII